MEVLIYCADYNILGNIMKLNLIFIPQIENRGLFAVLLEFYLLIFFVGIF